MSPMISGLALGLALLCAAVMGLAIQRGATCTVAAVDESLRTGQLTRLSAMVEASVWVACGLLIARELGQLGSMPAGYDVSRWTFIGATLLGLGAWVNQACAFGAIARLGSGQWAYLATPLGFYLGCRSVETLFTMSPPERSVQASPLWAVPGWVAWLLLAALVLRAVLELRRRLSVRNGWSPHTATSVIGITFVTLLLAAGSWAYTDVLAELAHGMTHDVVVRILLALALLSGALLGGRLGGQWRHELPKARQVARCGLGGLLMGWGSLLIPGGNDGLILLGMPLLWPFAWCAFATMCVVVALALAASNRFGR